MEASKLRDMFSLLEGHAAQQADAVSAYAQAKLGSKSETWVRLPRHAWPANGKWEHIPDPVCPLVLALYGHPESGGYWEQYACEQVKRAGFIQVPNWGSCYYHPELRLFLIVYVDDFKLAGPRANLSAGWTLLRQRINMEDPGPVSHFLGCTHRTARCRLSTGAEVRVMIYDLESFMKACVDAHKKIIPGGGKLRAVAICRL